MRTYDKRIGFLVSYQTLVPHGGIGQFAKSFCELMDSHNIKVDIITDKEPQDTEFVKSIPANIIAPLESLKYTDHSNIFMYGDTFCYERMANFRNSIVEALENNIYDVLVCNTYETVQVASTMGLEDVIQIIAYTHLESQIFKDTKNPFLYSTNELMRRQLEMNGIIVGTQSKFNQLHFTNAFHLPIPITEQELLKEHHKKALILGTGGASKAVAFALEKLDIYYAFASREVSEKTIDYDLINATTFDNFQIIINCTPLGTSPNIKEFPSITYDFFTDKHIAFDLVYNPEVTEFLKRARKKGATIKNGREMLVFQAEKAWKIWNK